jgi:hypothetical protein
MEVTWHSTPGNHVPNPRPEPKAPIAHGLNVIGHPYHSLPPKTPALTPFVFENKSHVWSKRKNAGFVSEKRIPQNTTKQIAPRLSSWAVAVDSGGREVLQYW